tara:strand:+ start:145 stop:1155 length:1011 start_codon:yes stop_codon:yes gene_type:complete
MNSIQFCNKNEIKDLQNFIKKNWNKNHILTSNSHILEFQHKNKDIYNFVISRNHDNIINGILGFIPNSQFDKTTNESKLLWLALWKVNEDLAAPGLGVSLLKFLEDKINPDVICVVGLNENVKKIYETLGFQTDKMNHFYFLNESFSSYKIIKNPPKNSKNYPFEDKLKNISYKKIDIDDVDENLFYFSKYKSRSYFYNRYINHPIYNYIFLGVFSDRKLEVVFIVRKIDILNSSCLRIIDIIGNIKCKINLSEIFKSILKKYNCEYIDCLNSGIKKEYFKKLGFSLKNNKTVIPEYFEPFERKNVDIHIAYKPKINDLIIYKGDGDQDRPNKISN